VNKQRNIQTKSFSKGSAGVRHSLNLTTAQSKSTENFQVSVPKPIVKEIEIPFEKAHELVTANEESKT
jgi:hypothetical protein